VSPRLRHFQTGDAATCRRLMHDAIRIGAKLYTRAQRAAWSPSPESGAGWHDRLADHLTLIAEDVSREGGRPVGFGTMRRDGHLDLLFVAPDRMGTGVAGVLHDGLLKAVTPFRPARLTARASLHARPVLAARGWRPVRSADQDRGGERLPAVDMERDPPSP
jgi:putative acetyltransferase